MLGAMVRTAQHTQATTVSRMYGLGHAAASRGVREWESECMDYQWRFCRYTYICIHNMSYCLNSLKGDI